MSEYWKPFDGENQKKCDTVGGMSLANVTTPKDVCKATMPVVGDKMLVRVHEWGHAEIITDDKQHTRDGETFIEVQVTAVKTAKVTLE